MGITASALNIATNLGITQTNGTVTWVPQTQYTARGNQGGNQTWQAQNGWTLNHYRARNGWRYFVGRSPERPHAVGFTVWYWLREDKELALKKARELTLVNNPGSVTLSRV